MGYLEEVEKALALARDAAKREAQDAFETLARQEERLRGSAVSKIQNAAMERAGLYWYNDLKYQEEFRKIDGPFMARIAALRLERDEAFALADMSYHSSMAEVYSAIVAGMKAEKAADAGQ